MRYAVILAGGSGTRLWPWSRTQHPKQLLPLVEGRSLLKLAFERLEEVVAPQHRIICAGAMHQKAICAELDDLPLDQYLAEPTGRDTAAALGYCAAVLHRRDPQAVIAVCTADHIIEPEPVFREALEQAFVLAEARADTLITFGIEPKSASTAYGWLQLGRPDGEAFVLDRFCEKPNLATAETFFAAGPGKYLWNSGMFVWRAEAFLHALERYEPEMFLDLQRIAASHATPSREQIVEQLYPRLKKISVDFAVMERAASDASMQVLALPLRLNWIDVGSWNRFAEVRAPDERGNAIAAQSHTLIDTSRTLIASDDPNHLIAVIGCEDLIIVHTKDATLVCRADRAEDVKRLQQFVEERYGKKFL